VIATSRFEDDPGNAVVAQPPDQSAKTMSVKLRKRLDLARDAEKVASSVPGLIVGKWVDQV